VSATLVIAVAGLVLSVLSLGWQAFTWRASGARVRLSVGSAIPTYGPELGPVHAQLTVRNVGRGTVEVSSWGVSINGGNLALFPDASALPNPKLPMTLAGGHTLELQVSTEYVAQAYRQQVAAGKASPTTPLELWVKLGDGKRIAAAFGHRDFI
jgi:hypothetical protein